MNVAIRVEGQAAAWLKLLVDYGHADEATVEGWWMDLADEARGNVITIDMVRRFAAAELAPEGIPEKGPLHEDWKLLFS